MSKTPRTIDPWFAVLAWWPLTWHIIGITLAWWSTWWILPCWILLIPALLCRMSDRCWPDRGTFSVSSWAARRWWWRQQLQMPFNRCLGFEEALRLIPGFYPLWLRLWGSQVALTCIFAPQTIVTDRQLVRVGHGVVLGNGCLLGSHLVVRPLDEWQVIIAEISIEAGALVGARTLLGPGVVISQDEQVPAGVTLRPFNSWRAGRRFQESSINE